MQVAEILSDLTSLRACDHEAALALVSSHKTASEKQPVQSSTKTSSFTTKDRQDPDVGGGEGSGLEAGEDPDLQRALDLVELHYEFKEKHARGMDMGLRKARADVNAALENLRGRQGQ